MSDISILDGRVMIHLGDVRARLAAMAPDSVDCVVTSPPYWGLRDYGVDGQIGLERTLGEHIEVMLEVFQLVRRVLKPSGTLWLNYGDCYATSPNGRSAAATKAAGKDDRTFRDKPFSTIGPINGAQARWSIGANAPSGGVLKPKDLCMVPNRLAIALQEDGWWVRSEIIWGKPNPMPESIRDRPATAHEKVFLLSKSERYFYDAKAVRQGAAPASLARWAQDVDAQAGSKRANAGVRRATAMKAVGGPRTKQGDIASSAASAGASSGRRMAGLNERWDAQEKVRASAVASPRHAGHINHTGIEATPRGFGRNLRNYEPAPLGVWPVAPQPFSDAHFATFPPELAERCILAGCPKDGLVLDPFGGAGTTGLVAARHGRRAALIELNLDYAEIARRRIERDWKVPQAPASVDFGPLFAAGEAAE